MFGAAAWHCTAGALGFVRFAVDGCGVGSQVFYSAKAFNENIGSWNTASVSNMGRACALLPSRATEVLFAAVVPAASGPGADVGMARLGCGRVPVQVWACPEAQIWVRSDSTVNESCVQHP